MWSSRRRRHGRTTRGCHRWCTRRGIRACIGIGRAVGWSLFVLRTGRAMVRRGRGILRLLPGPPQTGSVWRFGSGLLLSQFTFLRRQIDFLFRADNLFAIDGHDLEARHLIALEPHEINFFRRSAVYPFFVVLSFVILVANLSRRTALSKSHHFL